KRSEGSRLARGGEEGRTSLRGPLGGRGASLIIWLRGARESNAIPVKTTGLGISSGGVPRTTHPAWTPGSPAQRRAKRKIADQRTTLRGSRRAPPSDRAAHPGEANAPPEGEPKVGCRRLA